MEKLKLHKKSVTLVEIKIINKSSFENYISFHCRKESNQLNAILFAIIQHFNPFLPSISESYIKTKINLNFDFHTILWCLKRFYETFWDTTKKCGNKNLSFFSSPRIGTWTVKNTVEFSNFDSNAMVKMYGSVR